jgi:hypothetical protein
MSKKRVYCEFALGFLVGFSLVFFFVFFVGYLHLKPYQSTPTYNKTWEFVCRPWRIIPDSVVWTIALPVT